jgi:hypothetical protein
MKRKSIVILAALMLVIPITSSAEPQSGDGNANISSSLAVDSAVGTFGSLSAASYSLHCKFIHLQTRSLACVLPYPCIELRRHLEEVAR